jgi:protein-tyrosine phosphatase
MFKKMMRVLRSDTATVSVPETDLHSHLIPGIDDGAKTIDESLQLVRMLSALGYRHFITTPHTMMHRFPNTSETILRGLDTLREAIRAANIPVTVDAASEYYLDGHFLSMIRKKSLLTFGENEVLFEMSYVLPPVELDSILFELQSNGYTPVLAHPERYLYLHKEIADYARLKEKGVRFQVNINSLGGYYSKPVQQTAKTLMEEGWIDYLGSDTHHQHHVDALTKTLQSGIVEKVKAKNNLRNDLL